MSTDIAPVAAEFRATLLPKEWSLADVQRHLGDIPLERIRSFPPLGMATEADALQVQSSSGVLCEVVDGVLVEKSVGFYESMLAVELIFAIRSFLETHTLGIVLGPDGTLRLQGGNLRMPDVSFLSWSHFPNRVVPRGQVLSLAPDLAVEVLSPGNTAKEIDRKLAEYFGSGTQVAWIIDGDRREAKIYTSPQKFTLISDQQFLEAPAVLPGLQISLGELLDRVAREAE